MFSLITYSDRDKLLSRKLTRVTKFIIDNVTQRRREWERNEGNRVVNVCTLKTICSLPAVVDWCFMKKVRRWNSRKAFIHSVGHTQKKINALFVNNFVLSLGNVVSFRLQFKHQWVVAEVVKYYHKLELTLKVKFV